MEERVMDEEHRTLENMGATAALVEAVDALSDRELLEYVAGMLQRLEPLIDTLEKAQPALASMLPTDGKKPSPFKMALGAAKLAGGR
jgi:hypothetical protein